MTFWNFFDDVLARIQQHVVLPGDWPFGVFGRDPTEALIRFGSATAIVFTHNDAATAIVRVPNTADRTFSVPISVDSARQLGDEIGLILASIRDAAEA
jgi:hypothetical protein